MTDNEIIKALECCHKKECSTCPCYDDEIECGEMLIGHTIDLIKRKDEQINGLIAGQETLQIGLAEKNKEVERMQKENNDIWMERNRIYQGYLETQHEVKSYRHAYNNAKAEAIKDFAERMKEKGHIPNEKWNTTKEKAVYESDIDNLVKELTGQ